MRDLVIKEIEGGWYVSAVSKRVKYGQGYRGVSRDVALASFKRLVWAYENKGVAYVMRYGAVA